MRLDNFGKNFILVFIISIMGIWDVSPIFAQANQPVQETSSKCWALDVVVIVDMSGSMRINDPDNYRFDAVEEVIYELASNKQEECVDANHRIGLVTFSTEAISHINLKNINIRTEDNTIDWINDVFGNAVSDAKYVTAADTNFAIAFESAKTMFERAPKLTEPLGYGERRQLVVFITDGKPTYALDGSQKPTEALMCEWVGNLQQDNWTGKAIWILPLYANDSYLDEEGCNKTIRQNFEEIAVTSQGRLAEFTYNNQTIPSFVFELIANEFGQTTQKVSCNDVFYIDPYLASVKFSFFSEKNEDPIYVTLSKLDEKTDEDILSFRNGQVIVNKNNVDLKGYNPERDYRNPRQGKEQYTIYNPTPGKWRYQIEGMNADDCVRNVEGTKIQIFPEVQLEPGEILPQMPDAPYYDVNYPATFKLKLLDSDTRLPVTEVADYSLKIIIDWELPSGSNSLPDGTPILPTELLFSAETGLWESKNSPILTPELGVYKLTITGSAEKGNQKERFVLFKETRTFEVRALERIQFALLEPEAGVALSCNEFRNGQSVVKPLNVTVQLQDANKQPIVASNYLTLSQFSATYSGDSKIGPLSLIQDENGLFKGTFFADSDDVTECGVGNLTVTFEGNYDDNRYALIKDEIVLPVERVESKGVIVQSIIPEQDSTVLRFASPFDACSIENVQPISIVFSLADINGNQLDPRDLIVQGKDALYQVRVKAPGSNLWEDLDVTFKPSNEGSVLVASGGQNIQEVGKYSIEISPIEYAFARGYVADSNPIVFTFYRQDNWTTTRLACYSTWSFLIIFLVFLLGLIWYSFTGGPGGMVHFLDDNLGDIKSIRLSSMRIMNRRKYRYPELKEKDIDFVKFSGGSIGKDIRSVHITAVDISGETIWDSEIQANLQLPMKQGVIVEYSHPKHKDHEDLL